MNTWLPDFSALWMAENTTNTMHNILTLRGAQVRDSLKWAKYLQDTIDAYGHKAEVKFQAHHWPVWGKEKVRNYLIVQRDCYKYIHDQTVRMLNYGYVGEEISEMIRLPPKLHKNWNTRGYYGSLKHNTRAVYQFYMGWYTANPSDLNNLPPQKAARKYVEYMGGTDAILQKARDDFKHGEYRWVAMALKHVVFADKNNRGAKLLLADAYEQMGYQAESGAWRSCYLQGAYELRNGIEELPVATSASPDVIKAMPVSMMLDYFSVRLNPQKAYGEDFVMQLVLQKTEPDGSRSVEGNYSIMISNGTLNYSEKMTAVPDVVVKTEKSVLDSIQLGETSAEKAVESGEIRITPKDSPLFLKFRNMLDSFPFWFDIVTPRKWNPFFVFDEEEEVEPTIENDEQPTMNGA